MKVEKQKLETPKQFEPFNLVISVETEEEARALYAIFNYGPNREVLRSGFASEMIDAIGEYSVKYDETIAQGVAYKHFYRAKE